MAIYHSGECKNRPGVYLRFVNRGVDDVSAAPVIPDPEPPAGTDGLLVSHDGIGGVTITLPKGSTVSHDGAGNVTLSGLTSVAYDDEGNVTIGG